MSNPEDVVQLQVDLARERLESQRHIERNTFWTMVAVIAHAGVNTLNLIPHAGTLAAAVLAMAIFPAVLVFRRR